MLRALEEACVISPYRYGLSQIYHLCFLVSASESPLPPSFTARGFQSYILRLHHTIQRSSSPMSLLLSLSFYIPFLI
jgi:hypothetical protein